MEGYRRQYFPGSTVVSFAPETQAAMDLSKGLGFAQTGASPLLDSIWCYGRFCIWCNAKCI